MMTSNWFWRRRRQDQINPDQINIAFDARKGAVVIVVPRQKRFPSALLC